VQAPAPDPAAWARLVPRPELPRDRPLRVGFLVVDGVDDGELAAPLAVLREVGRHVEGPAVELVTVSPDGSAVTTAAGLRVAAERSFADAPAVDVLVVPGADGAFRRDGAEPAVIDWLRRNDGGARWVVALGGGTFAAARAGLLDRLAATTFPGDYDELAARFPAVDLRVNVSFVHDGRALTSQGGARSYDVALYLVDHLWGEAAARDVAAALGVAWPPDPHGQPRFVVVPRPATDPDAPPLLEATGEAP
jgi:transcriptional regulator GlxA family with amidase domain